jgi:hypothetical protein
MNDLRGAVETAYQRVLAYLASEEALRGYRLAYQHVAAVRQIRDQHLTELGGMSASPESLSGANTAPSLEEDAPSLLEGEETGAPSLLSDDELALDPGRAPTSRRGGRRGTVAEERRSRRRGEEREISAR